jgi:hypothetical protein
MVPAGSIRLDVQDGQYAIWDGVSDLDPPDPGGSGGLVGTAPGLAIVITGTQFGNIALSVQVDDSAPGLDTGPWDEVTEVSLTTGAGSLSILSGGDGPAELSGLTPPHAADYRVRVHARGRDAGASSDVVTGTPVEEHLLQLWPASAAPEQVHKTTDAVADGLKTFDGPWYGPQGRQVGEISHKHKLDVPGGGSRGSPRSASSSNRASATLRLTEVWDDGCMFEFEFAVDLAGLTPQEEKRGRRAIDGYKRAKMPGSTHDGPLRVLVSYSDGRVADSANRGDKFMAGLRPDGPVAYPFRYTIYPDGSRHVAEIGIWSWPLPPAEPFELSVEWPAIGLERATITLDGTAIMAELGASG